MKPFEFENCRKTRIDIFLKFILELVGKEKTLNASQQQKAVGVTAAPQYSQFFKYTLLAKC